MKSAQARLLDIILRVTRQRHGFEERIAGRRPFVSAEPGSEVADVAVVTRTSRAGHAVWHLEPRDGRVGAPHVLYLHGGAYVGGFESVHWHFIAQLVRRTGASVSAPEYPLAPGSTVPTTLAWTVDLHADLVAAGRPLVVMGDSAGAGLALSVAVAARDQRLAPPARLVLLSPWLDVGMTSAAGVDLDRRDHILSRASLLHAGRLYAGAEGVNDPRASPLFADLSGLPPTTVYCGGDDQLVADARRLATVAASLPAWELSIREASGMVHVWTFFDFLPEAKEALDAIVHEVAAAG